MAFNKRSVVNGFKIWEILFNTTNNRVESINAKLKSVISPLEEFVDKFFLILRVLRDHTAALCSHKDPTRFYSAAG